jgi:phospholipid/cholesterol/gamma-HCH transport system substrate-binding protein
MDAKKIITPFKVGLLVIVAAVGTIFMVTVLSDGVTFGTDKGYEVYAVFEDVTGLAKQSQVKMAGITIGYIEDIELVEGRARVDIQITKDIELHEGIETPEGQFKNGAVVTKTSAGFIGDYYLKITPGEEGPLLEDGDRIPNVSTPTDPSEILDKFDEIAANIEEVTASLAAVFGGEEGRKNLQEMLTNMQEMLDRMNQFVQTNSDDIERIVTNAETISEDVRRFTMQGTETLQEIIRDAQTVVQEVKFMVGQSSGDVQAGLGTLRGTLARLQSTLDSLNYSLQNVQDITDKVNEGEGTIGNLVNDPAIADRTKQILDDAGELVGRVSKLKTIVELRSEYHIRNQATKNVFALRLQPSLEKYYLIELIDDYRGTTTVIREDVDSTQADADDPQYRETTVRTTDEFKFSAQLARGFQVSDFLMIEGRFGIIESSGGIGGNVLLTEGYDLEIKLDLFDFGVSRYPRLRTTASYDILEFAYIAGGIDDALNPNRRDYFIGLGIQFDDEDLKALLTTTGVPTP